MKIAYRLALATIAIMAVTGSAHAKTVGVGLKVSTLGIGAEVVTSINAHINVRGVVNGYNYSRSGMQNTVYYDGKLKLFTAGVLLDFSPAANGDFHLTLGALYDGNKLTMTGVPTSGTYIINGVSYTASQVGSLDASVKFNQLAPYVGLGFGNAVSDTGFSVYANLGAIYQGTPKATLTATGSLANPALASNVAAEQVNLQNSLNNFKWWPVLAFGVDYSF